MVQWTRFSESKNPVPVAARQYNINDFVCYVCGIKTYRKRIRALRVVVRIFDLFMCWVCFSKLLHLYINEKKILFSQEYRKTSL